jgi:GLPGLI family protein
MKFGVWSGTLDIEGDSTRYSMPAINNKNKQPVKRLDDGSYSINQSSVNINEMNIYSILSSDIVYFETINKKSGATVAKDSLPNFNWDIQNNGQKTIGGFKCNLAIGHFRGSDLMAWYTEELPYSSGPWKFKGLPGLILEIQTVDKKFQWTMAKIKRSSVAKGLINFDNTSNIISYQFLIEKIKREKKEARNVSLSRLPRSYGKPEITNTRMGIEKIYEWETSDEKK